MPLPDTDSLGNYGGALENFLSGVTDPKTDRDASDMNRALASIAGATHTAVRAVVRFRLAGAGAPALEAHVAVWGDAPQLAPQVTRQAQGLIRVTWPTTVLDELGVRHALNLRFGIAQLQSAEVPTPRLVALPGPSRNSFDVMVRDANDAASDGSGQRVVLWVV